MTNAKEVVQADLNYICDKLTGDLDRLSGKRLLITGGAGFLGYYLVQAPLHWNELHADQAPIEVVVWDNFMRGVPGWLSALEGNPNLSTRKYDVIDPLPTDMGDFDFIIHAATIASPIYYRLHPIETMDANITGLRNLLDYSLAQKAKGKPVEAFLFYSTSEIYGDPTPENIPTPETYRGNVSCTGPRACYDESKRYGETLVVNFAQQHDLPVRTARPFNNYGPGLKITDRRALPDFARNVLNGEDIVLLSDGAPTRTFCYVADAVVGYYKVMLRGRNGEPYNVGLAEPEISIRQLAEHVIDMSKELFGYEGKLVCEESEDKDYLTDNPNRRCPIIDKAKAELDYDPTIQLEDGLRRSLLWYADNRDAEDL
jgi:nucleoside-diphosphate-sugar epimerase